jgi:hypothetical protein
VKDILDRIADGNTVSPPPGFEATALQVDAARKVRLLEEALKHLCPQICMPTYQCLVDAVSKASSSLQDVCSMLYPRPAEHHALEYLTKCQAVGIQESLLLQPEMWTGDKLGNEQLTKGIVCELFTYFGGLHSGSVLTKRCLSSIFQVPDVEVKQLWNKAKRTRQMFEQKSKSRKVNPLQDFMDEPFEVPAAKEDTAVEVSDGVSQAVSSLANNVSKLSVTGSDSVKDHRELQKENADLRQTLKRRADQNIMKIQDTREELSTVKRSRRHFRSQAEKKSADLGQSYG